MQRDPNQPSVSIAPLVVFGVLALLFGAFMYWLFPRLPVVPVEASVEAQNTDSLFAILMGIGGVVFFLVQGLVFYAAIAFRARSDDFSDGPALHGNRNLEIVWTIIPAIIVAVLAILSFITWRTNTAVSADPNLINGEQVVINAFGQRFSWAFEYHTNENNAEGDPIVINASDLHVYAGQEVELVMQTRDVIHSMWIPAMRVKQDLLPGRTTELRFRPIEPDTGWEYAGAFAPVAVYTEADSASEVLFDLEEPAEGEFPQFVELRLVDTDAESDGEWVEVVPPSGGQGFVRTEDLTGRFNRYRIVCAELCGGGHGNMWTDVYLYESETAFLNSWYNLEVERRVIPPEGPIAAGESLLRSGLACTNCHVLDSLDWNPANSLGPNLNGIADRAGSRAEELEGVESGAEYIAQSLRNPNAYVVAGFNSGIMPVFDPGQLSQEDINGIVAYLCTQTTSGNPEDSTCGLENFVFDDEGEIEDVNALEEELSAITGEYE